MGIKDGGIVSYLNKKRFYMSAVSFAGIAVPAERIERKSVQNAVLDVMKRILQNDDLKTGFWYPHQYYEVLRKTGMNEKRIEWFRSRGHFFHGYLPHKFFQHTIDGNPAHKRSPTGKITDFEMIPSAIPSEAMDALFGELALIDCANACQIAMYQAIREVIGDEKFNRLFQGKIRIGDYENPAHPLNPFLISCHDGSHPLTKWVRSTEDRAVGTRMLRNELSRIPVGARVVFTNVDHYGNKHPIGSSAAFNVIKAGEDEYYAFRISKDLVNEKEICNYLIQGFNNDCISADHLNDKTAQWYKTYSRQYADYVSLKVKDFEKEGGGLYPFSGKVLDEALIQEIAKLPLEKISWDAIAALKKSL